MKRIFSIFSLVVLSCMVVRAQNGSSVFSTLEPINKENIARLERLAEFGRGTINAVDWSPDGTQVAVGGSAGVWIYQADDLTLAPRIPDQHVGYVNDVLYLNNGKNLFVAGSEGTLHLLDTATYQETASYCFHGYENPDISGCDLIYHLGLSQNGKWLAIVLNDHVIIWDIETHKEIYRLFDDDVAYAEFALNDSVLVTASTGWSSSVRFWRIKALNEQALNQNPETLESTLPFPIWDMQVSDDSRTVIIAGFSVIDSGITTVDVESQKVTATYTKAGNAAAFISENIVAGSSTSGTSFIDIKTGEKVYTIETGAGASDIALSKDGQRVAIGTIDGNLFIHDLKSKTTTTSASGFGDYKWDVAFSEDGMSLAILTGNGIMAPTLASGGANGGSQIYFWNLWTDTFQSTPIEEELFAQLSAIVSIGKSDFLVAGYDDFAVSRWSPEKGFEDVVSYAPDYNRVYKLDASSNDEKIVISLVGASMAVGMLDLNAAPLQISYFGINDDPSLFYSVAIHPSGNIWGAADSRGNISIWEDGNPKAQMLKIKYHSRTDIDFSEDGQWLAANSHNDHGLDNITLFNTVDFSPRIVLTGQDLFLDRIKFSPASDLLFSSTVDGELVAWPVADEAMPIFFKAHSTNIRGLAINRQGTLIATCSFDGTVQVWGVRSNS